MRTVTRSQNHIGEWKVTIHADSVEEIFEAGARLIARDAGPVDGGPGEWETLEIQGAGRTTLLADWLNEMLARSEIAGRAFDEFRNLHVEEGRVRAKIRGRKVREWRSAVKAATYHGLELTERHGRWRAVVIFDV